jgi:hypothetical protein
MVVEEPLRDDQTSGSRACDRRPATIDEVVGVRVLALESSALTLAVEVIIFAARAWHRVPPPE